VSQKEVDRTTPPGEGQIAAPAGLNALRGKATLLSAAVTPENAVPNGHSRPSTASAGAGRPEPAEGRSAELWRALSRSLGVFTAARYARPSTDSASRASGRNGAIDGTALDAALAEGEDAVKRLRVRQILRFGRRRAHVESHGARQTWVR
jgi:hypothetical protein